ncbi:hypothetical protein Pst134EA_020882 [Puccinia striiformis f. sp. tritici]|uniref:hypothetical protein n=1 Tax=Puccinia striiformis f. sp. tritici TaxID=168172 RepID=UPI002007DB8B|nr:hypothetical protein Pst134EA_020871 [Puccinia striiformis f. sp. tritici]XP_047802182.1 hypothetical protein Pst134EA_020882 [Puccinia striiformis f. sp. tritici]KAH9456965.1 hypothetical protein Pst134EA_020871 [Puccinia striiformis f. sp. tritici]KAH9456976.1 hypothetical protein Pst134EA_020882 [Puccinia striiformis f. sp. tritici]KAI9620181.1 hypothetical protein H4Q26_013748 [Puccinia striiformis f. sp. tritici PST-130]
MNIFLTSLCVFLCSTIVSTAHSNVKVNGLTRFGGGASGYHWSKPFLNRTQHFQMGQVNVSFCHPIIDANGAPVNSSKLTQAKPATAESTTPVSLIPSACDLDATCGMHTLAAPDLSSCKVVIQTLMNNSTGIFIAPPNTWVIVAHGDCAATFQNNVDNEYTVQYNWAQLGHESAKLAERCLIDQVGKTGGSCFYKSYLDYIISDVGLELQRWDEDANIIKPT